MKKYTVSIIPCSKVKFRAPENKNVVLSSMMTSMMMGMPGINMNFDATISEKTRLSQFDDAEKIIEFAKNNSIGRDIYDEEYVSVWVTCIQYNNGDELHAPEFELLPSKVPFSLFIGKHNHDYISVTIHDKSGNKSTIDIECNQNMLPGFVTTEVLNLLRSDSNDAEFTAWNIYRVFENRSSRMDDPFEMAMKQEYLFDNPNGVRAARMKLQKRGIELRREIETTEKRKKLSADSTEKSNPFNDDFPDGLPGRTS